MKVLIATAKPFAAEAVQGIKKEFEGTGHEVVLLEKYETNEQLLDAVKDVDAMIVRSDKITAEVLDAAKNLKLSFALVPASILSTASMPRRRTSSSRTRRVRTPTPWLSS